MTSTTIIIDGQVPAHVDEEPPGTVATRAVDDKPPSTTATREAEDDKPPSSFRVADRRRLFAHVPEASWRDWRWQFRNRITTVDELTKFIPLTVQEQAQLKLVTTKYPLSVTPYYLSLIDPSELNDPIRKQAIPSFPEMTMHDMGMEDPLEEKRDSVVPGLVHRYPDRVLMVLTDICPMLCRHCTRKREWHNGGWVRGEAEIEAMLDYIRQHKEVRDVIISGGDPLTLATRRLDDILGRIRRISHVEIIRIGSRYPVVLPMRIDDELCHVLSKHTPIWLNTHFNSYREITADAAAACDRLVRSGVPVNNQCVLLRGVNDTVEAQLKLCHALLRIKVRPYYLFQCDEVQGTEHLRTPVDAGLKIIEGMRGHTSGLAIPTFVIDLPQGLGKIPLQPSYVLKKTGEGLIVRNYQHRIYHYRNPRPEASTSRRRNGNGNGNGHGNGDGNKVPFPEFAPLLKGEQA